MVRDSFNSWMRRIAILGVVLSALVSVTLSSAQTPKTLLIGVIGGVDSSTARGVELAVERFNARGNTVTPDNTAYTLGVTTQDANNAGEVTTALGALKQANVLAIFGPDQDDLVAASSNALLGAGLPIFTSTSTMLVAPGGAFFRTRADDSRQMTALAQYLATDLTKSKIAIFQGDPSASQRVTLFTTALTQLKQTPATTVIQVAGGTLKDSAKVLLAATPDAILAVGADDQAAQMLRELRGQGYNGLYVYPNAADQAFVSALPRELRPGIVGVTTWTPSVPTQVSSEFVRDYVALFGAAPDAQAAAAYDTAGAVVIAASRSGIQPQQITKGLLTLPRSESIQGHYTPALGNSGLSADVNVFTTGDYGAPVINARFDETGRLAASGGALPTLVPPATAIPPTSAQPTQPPQPTGPQPLTAAVKNSSLNVRRGPGTNYDIIGKLRQNDVAEVLGISPDGGWLAISFAQQQGWVVITLVTVNGSLTNIPVIEPPPSPTPPPATLTPTAQPYPDLIGLSAVINPPTPKSGQPFTVSIVIRNQGTVDAGHFAVAATFLPGNVYTAQVIPGLAAGSTTTVNLTATVTGPGTYTVAIVSDLNNDVNEGPAGEANNNFPFTYTVVP